MFVDWVHNHNRVDEGVILGGTSQYFTEVGGSFSVGGAVDSESGHLVKI